MTRCCPCQRGGVSAAATAEDSAAAEAAGGPKAASAALTEQDSAAEEAAAEADKMAAAAAAATPAGFRSWGRNPLFGRAAAATPELPPFGLKLVGTVADGKEQRAAN